ncbi:13559_t:CDS:1, partial [Ambispora leptoticha]
TPTCLEENVNLPIEGDCSKFVTCSNGIAYEMDCPLGLHFNDVLKVCDWPANANCER